jgi:hypothetical protein
MATRWLRNAQQRERYGVKSNRWLERARKDRRLPPPQYPFGNRIPANTEEELDAWDRAAVVAGRARRRSRRSEICASDSEMNPQE